MTNRTLLAAVVATALLAPASAARAATSTCDGLTATIVSSKSVIRGTSGNDVIVVKGKRAHKVYGLGGNDVICGSAGADLINGGAGDDVLIGNGGNDKLFGKAGADALFGGKGVDALAGGTGSDDLDGNDRGDVLNGGAGADVLHADSVDHLVSASTDDVQDDSEWLTLSAGEAALKVVLQTAGQALFDGLTADPATVTGSGNQATLPVDATASPYSLTSDQLALIQNVTWSALAGGEDEDGPRGCVDGIAADSGRSFKVRIEARDGHDSDEHDSTPGTAELRFTLGTCAFTWEHDNEGVVPPAAVSDALALASGVSTEHQGTADAATLAGLLLSGGVTGSGDVTLATAPANDSETAAMGLLATGTGYDLKEITWNATTPDGAGQFKAHACLVADDTAAAPAVTYHQSVEVEVELHDSVLTTKIEMHYLLGGCQLAEHD